MKTRCSDDLRWSVGFSGWRGELATALERYDFAEAGDVLARAQFGPRHPASVNCAAAVRVMDLDAEDFAVIASQKSLPEPVAASLRACAWPDQIRADDVTALVDLVPTYRLLLELVELYYAQESWPDVLALVHLVAEFLPLLAWQPVLGDAGRPDTLAARLGAGQTRFNPRQECALSEPQADQFRRLLDDPPRSGKRLREYLTSAHSRVATALAVCGGLPAWSPGAAGGSTNGGACRHPCAVVGPTADAGLAWRVTLSRQFGRSNIVRKRHASPVGHFFAVPSHQELDAAWGFTWATLVADRETGPAKDNPLVSMSLRREAVGSLPGLSSLVAACAGLDQPLEPSSVVEDLRAAVIAWLPGEE